MIYRFTCHCGEEYRVQERAIGGKFKCPNCGRRSRVVREILVPVGVYRFACQCGTTFRVEEKAIGGAFRCPKCRAAVRLVRELLSPITVEEGQVTDFPRSSIPVQFSQDASSVSEGSTPAPSGDVAGSPGEAPVTPSRPAPEPTGRSDVPSASPAAPGPDGATTGADSPQPRFTVTCPHCGAEAHPYRSHIGTKIHCRNCWNQFVVEEPAPPAAPEQAPAAPSRPPPLPSARRTPPRLPGGPERG